MSFNEKISYPIGGKQVQGGLPTANQRLNFNAVTNQWEFVAAPVILIPQTFARRVKKADQTRFNSSGFVNDSELFVPLSINTRYGFMLYLSFLSDATADFKYNFSIPAAANGKMMDGALSSAVPISNIALGNTITLATDGSNQAIVVFGDVSVAGSTGNLTVRFGQAIAQAITTTLFAGSYLIVWEALP